MKLLNIFTYGLAALAIVVGIYAICTTSFSTEAQGTLPPVKTIRVKAECPCCVKAEYDEQEIVEEIE